MKELSAHEGKKGDGATKCIPRRRAGTREREIRLGWWWLLKKLRGAPTVDFDLADGPAVPMCALAPVSASCPCFLSLASPWLRPGFALASRPCFYPCFLPWLPDLASCPCFPASLLASEVLKLWDRVLATNDLHLLPVLAAAVFLFRSGDAKRCRVSMRMGMWMRAQVRLACKQRGEFALGGGALALL